MKVIRKHLDSYIEIKSLYEIVMSENENYWIHGGWFSDSKPIPFSVNCKFEDMETEFIHDFVEAVNGIYDIGFRYLTHVDVHKLDLKPEILLPGNTIGNIINVLKDREKDHE